MHKFGFIAYFFRIRFCGYTIYIINKKKYVCIIFEEQDVFIAICKLVSHSTRLKMWHISISIRSHCNDSTWQLTWMHNMVNNMTNESRKFWRNLDLLKKVVDLIIQYSIWVGRGQLNFLTYECKNYVHTISLKFGSRL